MLACPQSLGGGTVPEDSDSPDERQPPVAREESLVEGEARLAPHGLRLIAFVVDVLFFALVLGLGLALDKFTDVPVLGLYVAAGVTFVYYMTATVWLMDGQTAGKAVAGLRVRRIDGSLPARSLRGLAWSFGRHSLGYVIADVLLLGAVSALFTQRRRCLHDYAFGSEVVLVGSGERAKPFSARYRAFWELCAARYEEVAAQNRWVFWPWKWLTRVLLMVATYLMFVREAVAAGTSPPASAAPAAKPLPLKGGAALWTATAIATGAAVTGIVSIVPEPDQTRNINVVTQRGIIGRPETTEIYIMKADGDQIRQITQNNWSDVEPDLFADQTIVFTSSRDGNEEIYVMSVDGTGQNRLAENLAPDWCPDWSPDGTRIAFTTDRDGNSEIYVMSADGSDPTRVTEHDAADSCPDWSSDGRRIAFTSTRDGNSNIYVMADDGTGIVQLTDDGGRYAKWSPDMTTIVFISDRDGNEDVYVIGADGRGERQLTNDPADDKSPFWAPDGSKILFASERTLEGGADELYAMNPDGSEQTKLTSFND